MLLDNDAFLSALAKMFSESKSGKSLFITMKRYDGRTKPIPRKKDQSLKPSTTAENSCLIRATLGNKKISTQVYQKDMNRFNQAYSNVIKGNLDGLKKRDKRSGADTSKTSVPISAKSAASTTVAAKVNSNRLPTSSSGV